MAGTNARNGGGRRLVLGFDAGCGTCSDLAQRIEEQVGDKLEVRSLNDPIMEHWREQALGKDAPWAPTLVEVEDGSIKAYTGARMGARLARTLGPAVTWRVAKILGDTRKGKEVGVSPYLGLSRSQFLKGVGGAVVGMSVLSGTGSLAAPAEATEHWLSQLSFASSKELSRKEAATAWAKLARGRHLRGFLSSRFEGEKPAVGRIRGRMLSSGKSGVTSPPAATIKGVSHQVKGGGLLLALVYLEGDALIATYRLDKPGQKTRLVSRVIEDESEETVRVLAEAEDSEVFAAPQGATNQSGKYDLTSRSSRCGSCGPCYGCRCVSANKRCMFNCCGPCALACANGWACLGCVLVWCPVCASINRCCYRKACRYISGC